MQRADTGHTPRVAPIQIATVRLALQECQSALAELGKHSAAQEVGIALGLLPAEHEDGFGEVAHPYNKGRPQH